MTNRKSRMATRLAMCSALALGLGIAATAAADSDDLITTASTAGTTAYIVGKNIDDDDFARAHDFADSQSVALRREAATGDGEHLDSLAALLGEDNPDAFGRWMQGNYAELYGPQAAQDSNVVDRIVALR